MLRCSSLARHRILYGPTLPCAPYRNRPLFGILSQLGQDLQLETHGSLASVLAKVPPERLDIRAKLNALEKFRTEELVAKCPENLRENYAYAKDGMLHMNQ